MFRRTIGVAMLGASVVYSALDLMGTMRPLFLRWRAHAGFEHTLALIFGSLSFKVVLLLVAAILAFWPEQSKP